MEISPVNTQWLSLIVQLANWLANEWMGYQMKMIT